MAANDNLDELTAPLAEMLREPIDPRTLPVRYSRLKHIDRSPAHYCEECQRADGEQTISMRLGSGVHAMVFNQPHSRYLKRRAGKDWDAYRADHPGHVILNAAEWERAERTANAIKAHPVARSVLLDDTQLEQHLDWSYNGRACSSRPDAFCSLHVADLKTTRNASPDFFIREALRMHYHVQLAAYREAIASSLAVEPPDRAYIIAVETEPPHGVAVYEISPRALEQGRATWDRWFDRLLVCEAANQWPSYGDAAILLDTAEDPLATWIAA